MDVTRPTAQILWKARTIETLLASQLSDSEAILSNILCRIAPAMSTLTAAESVDQSIASLHLVCACFPVTRTREQL